MQEDQDTSVAAAPRHTLHSTVIWTLLAIMTVVIGLLLSPIPVAGSTQDATVHSSVTDPDDTEKLNQFVQQEQPFGIDRSVLNEPDALPAPTPKTVVNYD